MPTAAFYVDGFNLYHSLKSHPKTDKALWLDLKALCEALKAPGQDLASVCYFTSLTQWNRSKMLRHQTFISALEHTGVEVIYGRFAPTQKECTLCGKMYPTHEEKETDVNISSRVIRDAVLGRFDSCYLLTGDSDQVATIKTVRELAPGREIVSVFSVNRHSAELKTQAYRQIQLSWKHFVRNQLPNPLILRPGAELQCPVSWVP